MIGYHFVGEKLRNGEPIPVDGEWLEHDGPVKPCKSGLHASEHPFDALRYAPGNTLCQVELEGNLKPHGDPVDKWVGRRRKILKRIDAEHLLRRFAADQALSVAHLWDMPEVVRDYLTTLDSLKRAASREAAWEASWDAAWAASDAAREAARAAARDAAWVAAWDAAWDANWAAAWDTNWAAARDAAREAARADFLARVELAFAQLTRQGAD